jgi:NADH dehydrogenase (ubiquinone) Fe-S protein 3
MSQRLSLEYIKSLSQIIPINGIQAFNNEIILVIDFKQIIPIIKFLRDHSNCQYKVLTAISGVDYLGGTSRFEINYELLSLKFNSRIRLKTYANEITPIKSIGQIS